MSSQSEHMRALKDAERQAAELVEEARVSRVEKMKTSSVEAMKVIEKYREKRQEDFDKEYSGKSGSAFNKEELDSNTTQELATMKSDYDKNKSSVVSMLVSKATEVQITIPKAWGITTKR